MWGCVVMTSSLCCILLTDLGLSSHLVWETLILPGTQDGWKVCPGCCSSPAPVSGQSLRPACRSQAPRSYGPPWLSFVPESSASRPSCWPSLRLSSYPQCRGHCNRKSHHAHHSLSWSFLPGTPVLWASRGGSLDSVSLFELCGL